MDLSIRSLCLEVGKTWAIKRVQMMRTRVFLIEDAIKALDGLVPDEVLEEAAILVVETARLEAMERDRVKAKEYKAS